MHKNIMTAITVTVLMAVLAGPAGATLITYTDRATFNGAVGSTTLIDFEALGPVIYSPFGSILTVGDVDFTDSSSRLFVFSPINYNTSATSNYLNNNAGDLDVVINFASSAWSAGMDLAWLYQWGAGTGGTVTFSLDNGESFTTSIVGPLANTDTLMDFVGFSSDSPFAQLAIYDPSRSLMLDNFAYATEAPPVPEPSTMLLLGAGLAGLVLHRRRRNQ